MAQSKRQKRIAAKMLAKAKAMEIGSNRKVVYISKNERRDVEKQ